MKQTETVTILKKGFKRIHSNPKGLVCEPFHDRYTTQRAEEPEPSDEPARTMSTSFKPSLTRASISYSKRIVLKDGPVNDHKQVTEFIKVKQ
jgi:hypothetical protein